MPDGTGRVQVSCRSGPRASGAGRATRRRKRPAPTLRLGPDQAALVELCRVQSCSVHGGAAIPVPFRVAELREALGRIEPLAAADPSTVRVARAPGRVNLIGEHTDYNGGLVLPVAISPEIRLAFVPTADRRVEITLAADGSMEAFDLDAIGPRRGSWIDYVAGTAWALAEAGVATRGLRGLLAEQPAAFVRALVLGSPRAGVCLGAARRRSLLGGRRGARAPAGPDDPRPHLPARGDAYVGVNCGLMDEAAESLGAAGRALLLDCRSLAWRQVVLPLEDHRLVVCHTGSPRRLESSEYNARRAECEAAVAALARDDPAITSLRDITPDRLADVRRVVPEVTFRRARHVVLENARVSAAIDALQAGDMAALGRLFAEAMPRCATISRSARRSSTRWWRSRWPFPASAPRA